MGKGHRPGRLGEEIRRIISDLLLRGIKDPRLDTMVSITAVDVTNDGSYATVYITVFEQGEDREEKIAQVLDGMNNAKGMMKREIGKQVKLRHIPDLRFKMDTSSEYGRRIDELIRQTVTTNEEE